MLTKYINDLLYRHDCVIVPEFGGFVANIKSAKINTFSNTFYPPYKQISFNSLLKENDGLLANYIAATDQITYDAALNFIKYEVEAWYKKLKNGGVDLGDIGYLTQKGDKIIFEPNPESNYLTSSFGLSPVVIPAVKREEYKKVVEELEEKAPVHFSPERRNFSKYLKYAAVFLLGVSLLGAGNKLYKNYREKQVIAKSEAQQKMVEQQIESATFVIGKPLPTLNLKITPVTSENENKPVISGTPETTPDNLSGMSYHVIAGAFRFPENAQKKLNQLLKQGYDAHILGVNKWGLTIVAFDSFDSKRDAINSLNRIRRKKDKEAWLLIQQF